MAAANTDLVITVPQTGKVARVEQPGPNGGREVFHLSTSTAGRLLAGLESEGLAGAKWMDLLGTLGVAFAYRRNALVMVISLPARVKQVKHASVARPINFHLPPTVWVLKYAQPADSLAGSYLFCTETQVRSVNDTVQCQTFPFGNSFTPAGNICWGNVVTGNLSSQDPMATDNLFFATGFNDHLVRLDRFTKPGGGAFGSVAEWAAWQAANDRPLVIAPGTMQFASHLNSILGGTAGE